MCSISRLFIIPNSFIHIYIICARSPLFLLHLLQCVYTWYIIRAYAEFTFL